MELASLNSHETFHLHYLSKRACAWLDIGPSAPLYRSRAARSWLDAVTLQLLKVLDGREGIIKVMEQTLPSPDTGKSPETRRCGLPASATVRAAGTSPQPQRSVRVHATGSPVRCRWSVPRFGMPARIEPIHRHERAALLPQTARGHASRAFNEEVGRHLGPRHARVFSTSVAICTNST